MSQRVLITAEKLPASERKSRAVCRDRSASLRLRHQCEGVGYGGQGYSRLEDASCDVSKRDEIERMVAAAVETLGGLDVLVNNAGIAGQTAPVEDADPDQWEAVMTVDVIGTFHVTRLSIPHLKKSAAGSIIVMSSLGGRFGYPNRSAYCTAKMGLIGFAKTLSRELGQYNIRVNAIAPGAVGGRPN